MKNREERERGLMPGKGRGKGRNKEEN